MNTSIKIIITTIFIMAMSNYLFSQTKVIAHRGFWDCAGSAQNSIASLKEAQQAGIYGSEFDVSMTSDGVLVVNHDPAINGLTIEETPYDQLKNIELKNGEKLPTLKSYLNQGKKDKTTKLILEIKPFSNKETEGKAVAAILQLIGKMKMQSKIEFISFSLNICKEIIRLQPKAKVAYLAGDKSPEEIKAIGLTGIDYSYGTFQKNPDWLQQAKELGLTTNVWTVNDGKAMQEMIELKVDYITSDKPLAVKAQIKQQSL